MIQGLGTGSRDLEAGVDERNGDRYVSCLHTVPADVLAQADSALDSADGKSIMDTAAPRRTHLIN